MTDYRKLCQAWLANKYYRFARSGCQFPRLWRDCAMNEVFGLLVKQVGIERACVMAFNR